MQSMGVVSLPPLTVPVLSAAFSSTAEAEDEDWADRDPSSWSWDPSAATPACMRLTSARYAVLWGMCRSPAKSPSQASSNSCGSAAATCKVARASQPMLYLQGPAAHQAITKWDKQLSRFRGSDVLSSGQHDRTDLTACVFALAAS